MELPEAPPIKCLSEAVFFPKKVGKQGGGGKKSFRTIFLRNKVLKNWQKLKIEKLWQKRKRSQKIFHYPCLPKKRVQISTIPTFGGHPLQIFWGPSVTESWASKNFMIIF